MGIREGDKVIRIGGAAASMADTALSVPQLLEGGRLHYLIFDYLAEGSMAIFGRMQAADAAAGYGTDFLNVHIGPHLRAIAEQGVRVIANAGGVNPAGLAAAMRAMIAEKGLNLTVAHIEGDDLRPQLSDLRVEGVRDMFDGSAFPDAVISANAYLGAFPIAAALEAGADIVITGRIVDSALALGPLIHEFGWGTQDYDLLAAGTLTGHLLECGAQVTGGTFTDWRDVPDWANIGYPIGECHSDGSVVMTKIDGTGGLVSIGTVAEQILYEVSDPADYIVADVRCDFGQVQLEHIAPDRVRVTGARGHPPTDSYKVCVTYDCGWRAVAYQPIIGEDAAEKAMRQGEALFARAKQLLAAANLPDFTLTDIVLIGGEASFGAHAAVQPTREVIAKLVADHPTQQGAALFAREQWAAISGMAVGTSINLATSVQPMTGLFQFLYAKDAIAPTWHIHGTQTAFPAAKGFAALPQTASESSIALPDTPGTVAVDLVQLAYARSGDKGHLFNVAVIARRAEYLPYLKAALTADAVSEWYRHLGPNGAPPRVDAYEAPGLNALNFVINDALAGGINTNTRLDPAAKGMAQMLLRFPVKVPATIAATLSNAHPKKENNMADYAYLMQGIKPVATDSSVLVSSSKYLNDARVRDWVATHNLRRNGPDIPTPSDSIQLVQILREVQDVDHINALFAAERAANPALDAWFNEGFVSRFTLADLAHYAPGTLGGIFHAQLSDNALDVNIVPPFEPKNDFEYFQLRAGQTHDLEHILGGGGFDFIGELVPYYMRLTNIFTHLSPELAGELCAFSILGSTRIVTRAVLHYPQTWLVAQNAMERGARVGRESAPIFMMTCEDAFDLPLEEAREALGIRGAQFVDTAAASAQWN